VKERIQLLTDAGRIKLPPFLQMTLVRVIAEAPRASQPRYRRGCEWLTALLEECDWGEANTFNEVYCQLQLLQKVLNSRFAEARERGLSTKSPWLEATEAAVTLFAWFREDAPDGDGWMYEHLIDEWFREQFPTGRAS